MTERSRVNRDRGDKLRTPYLKKAAVEVTYHRFSQTGGLPNELARPVGCWL